MKTLVLAFVLIILGFTAIAQKTNEKDFHFSVGPEISFATGKFSQTHSVGFGATAQISYRAATSTDITLTSGFVTYLGKSAGAGIKFKGKSIIPIKVGVKYYLTEGFYGQAQLGVGIFDNSGGTTVTNPTIRGTAFAFSPVMGYEFDTKSGQAFDVGIKYDGYFKSSTALGAFGIRLAYKF